MRWMPALLAAALLVAGCDGGGGGTTLAPTTTTTGGAEVMIHASEFAFDPADVEVTAGSPVTFVLMNSGVIEHDFTIDALNLAIHVDPAQTTRETVTIPAGTYDVYCSIPGHREAGMVGTLTAR